MKTTNMLQVFQVGDHLRGYCEGYFGRGSYNDKVCVFVSLDYAVFETKSDSGETIAEVINFAYNSDLTREYVKGWME